MAAHGQRTRLHVALCSGLIWIMHSSQVNSGYPINHLARHSQQNYPIINIFLSFFFKHKNFFLDPQTVRKGQFLPYISRKNKSMLKYFIQTSRAVSVCRNLLIAEHLCVGIARGLLCTACQFSSFIELLIAAPKAEEKVEPCRAWRPVPTSLLQPWRYNCTSMEIQSRDGAEWGEAALLSFCSSPGNQSIILKGSFKHIWI